MSIYFSRTPPSSRVRPANWGDLRPGNMVTIKNECPEHGIVLRIPVRITRAPVVQELKDGTFRYEIQGTIQNSSLPNPNIPPRYSARGNALNAFGLDVDNPDTVNRLYGSPTRNFSLFLSPKDINPDGLIEKLEIKNQQKPHFLTTLLGSLFSKQDMSLKVEPLKPPEPKQELTETDEALGQQIGALQKLQKKWKRHNKWVNLLGLKNLTFDCDAITQEIETINGHRRSSK